MRNSLFRTFAFVIFIFQFNSSQSQTLQTAEQVSNMIDDALFFANIYITPATDAAIYQSSPNWVTTPQKKKLWDATLSFHSNFFFVPNKNSSFVINNSDFKFFKIENATSATVPTSLGSDNQVVLIGQINDGVNNNEVKVKTPKGIDSNSIIYPYLQGSLGLLYGTELVVKYSTKVKLKKSKYQVYGIGLKHNLSQYFKKSELKKIYFSGLIGYSKEEISFDLLSPNNTYGTFGLNQITGLVNTWQLQVNGSKKFKKLELMAALISNFSSVKYEVGGQENQSEISLAVQPLINSKLTEISATKTNLLGEVALRYQIGKVFLQSSLDFGKFVNSNLSVQYEF